MKSTQFSFSHISCGLIPVDLTHIFQGYFTGTGAVTQCQWTNPRNQESCARSRASCQNPIRRLTVKSRKVSKPRDLYLELYDRSEIWQAHRQQGSRSACQISKRCDNLNYQSRGFEISWDLTIRRLIVYWNAARVSRSSNYIPQYLWDVITCFCPWYLALAQHFLNKVEWITSIHQNCWYNHNKTKQKQTVCIFYGIYRKKIKLSLESRIRV